MEGAWLWLRLSSNHQLPFYIHDRVTLRIVVKAYLVRAMLQVREQLSVQRIRRCPMPLTILPTREPFASVTERGTPKAARTSAASCTSEWDTYNKNRRAANYSNTTLVL